MVGCTRPWRVLLVGTSLRTAYGGPALSVARLAEALTAAGVEVGLWSPDGSVATTPYLAAGSRVIRLTGGLVAAARGFGPVDLIHDNGLWLPHHHALAVLAGRLGVPRLVSTRGMLEPWALRHKRWKKHLAWMLYQRRDLCRAAGHHATSCVEGDNLRRLALGVPIAVVPNGVDVPTAVRPAGPAVDGRRVALFLGRLYPVKGLPLLIEAWARVRPAGWRLRIAGPDEGGHRRQLEALIATYGLGGEVHLTGEVAVGEKAAVFGDADLFLLPSHSESFGMAVAEALAHGVPVVTTMAVPWPELAAQGCGWRIEPSVAGVAEGLRAATALDAHALDAMGRQGREWMLADFAWPAVAERMLAAYAAAMAA
jgi:glycosyltransferase involved in cell wall biosynthesis